MLRSPILSMIDLTSGTHAMGNITPTGGDRFVETLIVAGAMTNLCCETTSRSAFTRGFDVVFAADANGTLDETMHCASVDNLRFFGCHIMTTDQVAMAIR